MKALKWYVEVYSIPTLLIMRESPRSQKIESPCRIITSLCSIPAQTQSKSSCYYLLWCELNFFKMKDVSAMQQVTSWCLTNKNTMQNTPDSILH